MFDYVLKKQNLTITFFFSCWTPAHFVDWLKQPILALVPPAAGIHCDLFHPSIINLPIESLESSRPDDCSRFRKAKKRKKNFNMVQCCYISRTPPIRKECLDEFWFVPCLGQIRPLRNFLKVLSWNRLR